MSAPPNTEAAPKLTILATCLCVGANRAIFEPVDDERGHRWRSVRQTAILNYLSN